MTAQLSFNCIACSMEQLAIIEAYEDSYCHLLEATSSQKNAIVDTGGFSYQDLYEDHYVEVKQFTYQTTKYICVEWSRIHYFYVLLN